MPDLDIKLDLPEKFIPAYTTKCRYVVYYGGRGAGKTYSFAIIFILKALSSKVKILCCREIMNSIKDSVFETIILAMEIVGVKHLFNITNDCITCKLTGSTFIFAGLYRNQEKIKSIPAISYAWINEADKVSEDSLNLLFPTLREQGSQIFIEFNPAHEDDEVYKRFVLNAYPDSLVVMVSWRDNPFISQTLLTEKDTDFAMRPQEAEHIWEGKLKTVGANVWCPPFEQDLHIAEFDMAGLKDHRVFQAIDPHTSYYTASIWAARWKQGDRFYTWIFKEWPSFADVSAFYSDIRKSLHYTGTVADLARAFFAAETGHTICQRYIDTRFAKGFGSKQTNLINSTEGLVESFAKPANGGILYLMPQEINIDAARDKIKVDMQWNTMAPRTVLNEPCLYVSGRCKNVIRALRHHRFNDDNEGESEIYKDFSDCIRILYAGLGEYRWPNKPKPRPDVANYGGGGWMGT